MQVDHELLKAEIYAQMDKMRKKDQEEMEVKLKKLVKESLLEMQKGHTREYYEQNKSTSPENDMILMNCLENKEEILKLTDNFESFKTFITNEIEQINDKTQTFIDELRAGNMSLWNRMSVIEQHLRETVQGSFAKGFHLSSSELPDVDGNKKIPLACDMKALIVPNIKLGSEINAQNLEEELYKLQDKIKTYEKKLEEGMYQMENTLKVTSQKIKEMNRYYSVAEIKGDDENSGSRLSTKKRSLFGLHAGMHKRYGSEFVEPIRDVADISPIQRKGERSKSIQWAIPQDNEEDSPFKTRPGSLDTLDLSDQEIKKLRDYFEPSLETRVTEVASGQKTVNISPTRAPLPSDIHSEVSQLSHGKEQSQVAEEEEKGEDLNLDLSGREEEGNYGDEAFYEPAQNNEFDVTPLALREEIASIWATLNKVVSNTQDCIQELRFEMNNNSPMKGALTPMEPIDRSVFALRREDSVLSVVDKTENEPEKGIKDVIVEVKDDVHNQILGVQRELAGEVLTLKDNLVNHYTNFAERLQLGQLEIKKYIDEKLEMARNEMHHDSENYTEDEPKTGQFGSAGIKTLAEDEKLDQESNDEKIEKEKEEQIRRELEEQLHKEKQFQKEKEEQYQKDKEEQLQKEKEEQQRRLKEEQLQRELIKQLQQTLSSLQGDAMKSIWETISMIVKKVDKIEQSLGSKKK